MKQPELGKRIARIRKEQNLTQEELVEKCHVSVRTIQRIEAGEVTPRVSTVKIIAAALDHHLEDVVGQEQNDSLIKRGLLVGFDAGQVREAKAVLQTAWIAGIVYFVLGLVDAGVDFLNLKGNLTFSQQLFFAVTKVSVFLSYLLFVRGFILLGQLFEVYVLKVGSYIMAAAFLVFTLIQVYDVFLTFSDEIYFTIMAGCAITVGATGVVLGVGFWKLQDGMGRLAALAGGLELLVGLFFLSVVLFFLGYLLLVPATIIEIILLFKAYEFLSRESKTVTGDRI